MFQVKWNKCYLAKSVKTADTFFSRLIGLMFIDRMVGFDGLLIKRSNSIHTFFMKFNLDVIFLNENYQIKKIIRNLAPWRVTGIYWGVSQVLELNAGSIPLEMREGDFLIREEGICIS